MKKFGWRAGLVLASGLALAAWGQQTAGQQIGRGAGEVSHGTESGAKRFGHGVANGFSNVGHGIAHGTTHFFHSARHGFHHGS